MNTTVRSGWRSRAPLKIKCHNARCAHHCVSYTQTANELPHPSVGLGPALPPWWLTTTPASAHAAHSGSQCSAYSGGMPVPGAIPGSNTPPRRPSLAICATSATASSKSPSRICPTPARRSGDSEQKSASQRLWARSPAQRSSSSRAVSGGGAARLACGKNGGTVLE